jgi:hypothetical protein
MPYAVNSLRMSQEIKSDQRGRWFRWLAGSLLISTLVSGAAHHYLSYTHGRNSIPDHWASDYAPFSTMEETFRFAHTVPETTLGASWGHFSVGLGMIGLLMVGRVMWVGWPFHPIGLVLMNSGPLQQFWFSIFIGWCIKRLLLHYGGASAFRRARPFFIGLIVGEILAAGVWMFVGLVTQGAVSFTLFPR